VIHRSLIIVVYIVLFWIILPAVLIASGLLLDRSITSGIVVSGIFVPIGIAVAGISAVMLFISIVQFRRFGRELPISALPPDMLIQNGLFCVWRHPIYLFYFLVLVGCALIIGSVGLLLIVLPFFALLTGFYIVHEEKVLIERFGKVYVNYRKRTPLVIPHLNYLVLPFVWLLSRLFFRLQVLHRELIPRSSPFFVVAAHRNYLDPLFVSAALGRRIHFISTFKLFRQPLKAAFYSRLGAIPRTRFRSDFRTVRGIADVLRCDGIVGIFPEGERSWTGSTNSWKPEVLRLFRAFPDVPVLPVRIDGNYRIWPRWASGIRRAKLKVTFMNPVMIRKDQSPAELEILLREKVEPDDSSAACRKRPGAGGIGKLLYRCPACRSFGTVSERDHSRAVCSSCGELFELLPDYTLRYRSGGTDTIKTLEEVYDEIRVTAEDLRVSNRYSDCNEQLAYCESATAFREEGIRLIPLFTGSLKLTDTALICGNTSQTISIPLEDIQSVTTESNCRLQVYEAVDGTLYQFTFAEDSVLKWQDYLIESIRGIRGCYPNRR